MINIKLLRELEGKASGGAWEHFPSYICGGPLGNLHIANMEENLNEDGDAALITESRNQLPAILDFVERVRPLLAAVAEFSRGCSCAIPDRAHSCGECLYAFGRAITKRNQGNEAAKLLGEIE